MELKVISDGKSFYKNFQTRYILRRFLNPWYLTEVFETHDILTEVLKSMIFNRGFEKLFLRFKKTLGNTFHRDGLAGKTVTLDK